ncbi:MAG: FeoA family protein [Elusimicrobiota bacterium]
MTEISALSDIDNGQSAEIVRITGGLGLNKKLENMGIRKGTKIVKISGQLMRGPVMVRAGNIQFAIGFGMAKKILVKAN